MAKDSSERAVALLREGKQHANLPGLAAFVGPRADLSASQGDLIRRFKFGKNLNGLLILMASFRLSLRTGRIEVSSQETKSGDLRVRVDLFLWFNPGNFFPEAFRFAIGCQGFISLAKDRIDVSGRTEEFGIAGRNRSCGAAKIRLTRC